MLAGREPGSVELLKVVGGRRLEFTPSDEAKVAFPHLVSLYMCMVLSSCSL